MSSGLKRRRLVKKHLEDSDVYRIPKKASTHTEEKDHSRRLASDSDDEGMEDFIADKVEFLSDHLPSSSEESAHSTDEERTRKRRREEGVQEEEESAHETESAPEETPEPSDVEVSESDAAAAPDPTRNLIGKEALAAKRAQGLLPPKSTEIPKTHHHSKKHHKHKHKHKHNHRHKEEEEVKKPPEKHRSAHKKTEKESKKYVQFGEFETAEERSKADLVTKILVRWWYVLPDWPPPTDYAPLLAGKNLRLVDANAWLQEPQLDSQGREKVREVCGFTGVFQNSKGLLFDFRENATCPSFNNLFVKPAAELRKLLATALEKQLGELSAQPDCDPKLAKQLGKELKLVGA